MAHRQDHLHHPGDARGGLGVADVGLHRAQQQRTFAVLAVGGEEGAGLDGVAQPRTGAVRLHRVHVGRGQAGGGQCVADHAFLRRATGSGQAVRGAVLVHGAAAEHREYLVAVAAGIRQALHEQHADALGETGAVRARSEGLAAAVLGQAPLTGELDEQLRRGHHSHPTGQRQVALAAPQGLGSPVQGDQGRGAGGVDGDRRALQTEGVGDAAGGDAGRAAVAEIAVDLLGGVPDPRRVVVVDHAGEDASTAAAHRVRVDAGAFEGLPGGLQQQALLRVHRQRLTAVDAEELRVEFGHVVEEAAGARVGAARCARLGVVDAVQVPAAVARELRQHAVPFCQRRPEGLR